MGVSGPIVDSETNEFLGVIAARVDLEKLYKIVTDHAGFGKTEEIFIINKYGYMITPSRFLKDTFLKKKVDTENSRIAQYELMKKRLVCCRIMAAGMLRFGFCLQQNYNASPRLFSRVNYATLSFLGLPPFF